jgi:hypothetical protein
MKVGSAQTVDEHFRKRTIALEFRPEPNPPKVLPAADNRTYFRIVRESQRLEWDHVLKTLQLAVRIDEEQIDGEIDKQTTFKLRRDNADLTFWLVVVLPQT